MGRPCPHNTRKSKFAVLKKRHLKGRDKNSFIDSMVKKVITSILTRKVVLQILAEKYGKVNSLKRKLDNRHDMNKCYNSHSVETKRRCNRPIACCSHPHYFDSIRAVKRVDDSRAKAKRMRRYEENYLASADSYEYVLQPSAISVQYQSERKNFFNGNSTVDSKDLSMPNWTMKCENCGECNSYKAFDSTQIARDTVWNRKRSGISSKASEKPKTTIKTALDDTKSNATNNSETKLTSEKSIRFDWKCESEESSCSTADDLTDKSNDSLAKNEADKQQRELEVTFKESDMNCDDDTLMVMSKSEFVQKSSASSTELKKETSLGWLRNRLTRVFSVFSRSIKSS